MKVKLNYDEKYFHKQQEERDCWFACFLMVRDMVRQNVSDYQTVKELLINNGSVTEELFFSGVSDWDLRDLLNSQLSSKYVVVTVPDEDSIVAGLNSGFPVIIGLDRSDSNGHFCIVIGVDTDSKMLDIVDPNDESTSSQMHLPSSGNVLYYKL